MLDVFNIPGQQDNIKLFYASDTNTWQTWQKPRGCKFIWTMCIGAGSGGFGGAGAGGAANAPGGPGGAITKALFLANVLPDTLYIQPGTGSTGGAGAVANINNIPNVPGRSFISIVPSSATVMNIVCTSGLANASGGTPESAATVAAAGLLSLGNFTSIAGASAAAAGSSLTPLTTTITCAGANGSPAGQSLGASISSVNLGLFSTPTIFGGGGSSTTDPNTIGKSGVWSWKPIMYGLGASGGGGVTSGTAGNGGNADSYGCGGGGGGNSGAGTGGNGGKGGDGLVIIATF
jgi:hypothetical protein